MHRTCCADSWLFMLKDDVIRLHTRTGTGLWSSGVQHEARLQLQAVCETHAFGGWGSSRGLSSDTLSGNEVSQHQHLSSGFGICLFNLAMLAS